MNNYIRLINKLKRVTNKAKMDSHMWWDQGTSKNRTLWSNVLQGEELGWKENHEIQNIAIEEPKGNIIADKRQVLKIWENYVTEL